MNHLKNVLSTIKLSIKHVARGRDLNALIILKIMKLRYKYFEIF